MKALALALFSVLVFLSCRSPFGTEASDGSSETTTFAVTYNGNGHENGSPPVDSSSYEEGDTVEVFGNENKMSKDGYGFAGWNTTQDGAGESRQVGTTFVMPGRDLTLYAQWGEGLYRVSYAGNGNDEGFPPFDTSEDKTEGDSIDLLGNSGNLRKARHGFIGWNSEPNGSGEFYEVGSIFTMPGGDVTLYAHWKDDYEVGDEGPAGGWVFYDHGELHAVGWRFLEAAPEDISENGAETFEWSNVDRQSVGGTSTDLGSGADNTLAIIEQDGHETSAAQRTIDYATTQLESTFGDWFLPSLDELAELYNRLHENPESTFVEAEYWSSSESGSLSAQVLDFASGESATRGKSFLRRVRATRGF